MGGEGGEGGEGGGGRAGRYRSESDTGGKGTQTSTQNVVVWDQGPRPHRPLDPSEPHSNHHCNYLRNCHPSLCAVNIKLNNYLETKAAPSAIKTIQVDVLWRRTQEAQGVHDDEQFSSTKNLF